MTTTEMRVWVGCLACYNNGELVGEWIDATEAGERTSTEIHAAQIEAGKMGTTEHYGDDVACDAYGPHEELWCFDHEGFGDLLRGECSPCDAQEIAEGVEDLDGDELEGFAAWYDGQSGVYSDFRSAIEEFREHWHGVWDSEKDFAYDFAEQTMYPGHDGNYFDWDAYTRDLFFDFTAHPISGYRIAVTSDN